MVPVRMEQRNARTPPRWFQRTTTFEQVILANSVIIIASVAAAYWVTHHSLETYHFLIDTSFVLLATLAAVGVNALLLRRAFAPLFALQEAIQQIQAGETASRATVDTRAADVAHLAAAFNAMLDDLEASRREGLEAIARAQEDERRRLALDLHDATGQELTALIMRLNLLEQDLTDLPQGARALQQAQELQALVQRSLLGVQTMARQLRPAVLDDLGFVAALHWLGKETGRGTLRVTVTDTGWEATAPPALPSLTEVMLFRVAQEALANAIRHSGATEACLVAVNTGAQITLEVRDNGRGFAAGRPADGVGLRGMRERMRLVGGTLAVRSGPDGVWVTAVAPLAEVSR